MDHLSTFIIDKNDEVYSRFYKEQDFDLLQALDHNIDKKLEVQKKLEATKHIIKLEEKVLNNHIDNNSKVLTLKETLDNFKTDLQPAEEVYQKKKDDLRQELLTNFMKELESLVEMKLTNDRRHVESLRKKVKDTEVKITVEENKLKRTVESKKSKLHIKALYDYEILEEKYDQYKKNVCYIEYIRKERITPKKPVKKYVPVPAPVVEPEPILEQELEPIVEAIVEQESEPILDQEPVVDQDEEEKDDSIVVCVVCSKKMDMYDNSEEFPSCHFSDKDYCNDCHEAHMKDPVKIKTCMDHGDCMNCDQEAYDLVKPQPEPVPEPIPEPIEEPKGIELAIKDMPRLVQPAEQYQKITATNFYVNKPNTPLHIRAFLGR
jgi:hypothetical protein